MNKLIFNKTFLPKIFFSTFGIIATLTLFSKNEVYSASYKYKSEQTGVVIEYLNSASDPMPGEVAKVTMYFKNTGTEIWRKTNDNKKCEHSEVCLGTANPIERASVLGDATPTNLVLNWISNTRPTKMNETAVSPGSVASFTFNIKIPEKPEQTLTEYFAPVVENISWVDVANFTWKPVKINLGSNYAYSISKISVGGQTLKNGETFKKIGGEIVPVEIRVKNSGKSDWKKGSEDDDKIESVRLGVELPKTSSVLSTGSWLKPDRPAMLQEEIVKPGEYGTFKFSIKSPVQAGFYRESFQLVSEGREWIEVGDKIVLAIESQQPKYAYEIISKDSLPSKMEAGEQKNVTITAKNTGNVSWYRNDGSNPNITLTKVGTNNPTDHYGTFFADLQWENYNRASVLREAEVKPGEIGHFDMVLTAPFAGGKFIEEYSLVAEYIAWMSGPSIKYETNVDQPIHQFQFIAQKRADGVMENSDITDDGIIFMKTGEIVDWWIKLKNTGNYTWRHYPGDKGNIRFAAYCSKWDPTIDCSTYKTPDRKSIFYVPGSWIKDDRLSTFSEETVPPGAEATFEFKLKAPTTPMQKREYFRLVNEWVSWLTDIGVYFEPKVSNDETPVPTTYQTTQTLFSNGKTISIPLAKTKVGLEQHLPVDDSEVQKLTEASVLYSQYKAYKTAGDKINENIKYAEWKAKLAEVENSHYLRAGTNLASRNGFASSNWGGVGKGAFYPPTNSDYEKYYITMRWPFVQWKWNGGVDRSDASALATYSQYKGKKILVKNVRTGKSVVVSILESGPAPWTGTCYDSNGNYRKSLCGPTSDESKFGNLKQFGIDSVNKLLKGDEIPLVDNNNDGREDVSVGVAKSMRGAGLSPEAFEHIGGQIDDIIEVGFLVDQSLPLGPVS